MPNGSLFIRHVTLEDRGNYQCVAFLNSVGSMASRMAKLQVAGKFFQERNDSKAC